MLKSSCIIINCITLRFKRTCVLYIMLFFDRQVSLLLSLKVFFSFVVVVVVGRGGYMHRNILKKHSKQNLFMISRTGFPSKCYNEIMLAEISISNGNKTWSHLLGWLTYTRCLRHLYMECIELAVLANFVSCAPTFFIYGHSRISSTNTADTENTHRFRSLSIPFCFFWSSCFFRR